MTEIIPAILPKDFTELQSGLASIRNHTSFVQIDVCDGEFVPSTTWPYGDPDNFSKILSEESGMPFWEDFQFEFDLMVARPEEVVQDWIDAGATRIIIHNKSTEKLEDILLKLDEFQVERGVALQISESPSDVAHLIDKIDFIQWMGIAQIGKQGEPFAEEVVHKIRESRELFPDIMISVDGGVNFVTAKELASAGADRLVSGSAILKAEDPKEALERLRELVSHH